MNGSTIDVGGTTSRTKDTAGLIPATGDIIATLEPMKDTSIGPRRHRENRRTWLNTGISVKYQCSSVWDLTRLGIGKLRHILAQKMKRKIDIIDQGGARMVSVTHRSVEFSGYVA